MHDEEIRSCLDLSYYRLERAGEDLQTAKNNYEDGNYRAANNRAYYSIFHSLRSVMALDQYDSKKHSGIISAFRKKYIKNDIFSKDISAMIDEAFEIRNASDYNDMFIADKNETRKQIENAEYVFKEVKRYIGPKIGSYTELFDKEGLDKNSQILNLLLVSFFSSDTIVTIFDCDRSERELLKVKWAIDETKLPEENKVYWKDVVNKGIEICRKDRERL